MNSRSLPPGLSKIYDTVSSAQSSVPNTLLALTSLLTFPIGALLLILPHALLPPPYSSHSTHSILRLYATTLISSSYLTLRSLIIKDWRLRKILTEAYALTYALQGLVLLRSLLSAPGEHGWAWYFLTAGTIGLAGVYGRERVIRGIKQYALPEQIHEDNL